MVFVSELQRNTLLLINELIDKNTSYEDILYILMIKDYTFVKEIKNGYMSKTKTELYKNNENSFVTLIKRRNGLADFETMMFS